MTLLGNRDYYKPFEYPWMFDYYVLQNQMHWMPESVPLHTDVKDWQELSDKEKNLLTQIFRLFTQSDVDVGAGAGRCLWRCARGPSRVCVRACAIARTNAHAHARTVRVHGARISCE
mgnify:CR=1 FL=1